MALDLTGQRLDELIYGSLTKKNKDMQPRPDLSRSWKVEKNGTLWRFQMRPDAQDHSGAAITAERMAACLENYRSGVPHSPHMGSFSSFKKIEAKKNEVWIELTQPDPYLATNLTLLNYFTTGDPSKPCQEPKPGQNVVTSGRYRPARFSFEDLTPEHQIELLPVDTAKNPLIFSWSIDDNTKALKLIRGEVDVLSNSLSLSKTRWIENHFSDRFRILTRSEGVNVSYLIFNFRHPILALADVRKAIALSINREDFVKNKLYGFGSLAGTLLSPILPESAPQTFSYNPSEADRLLEKAGFPRKGNGIRFSLHLKTTPVRDGLETAQILQSTLQKIGIELILDVVEPAVFFASVRKGSFDLYSSRWVGISDASIFQRTLKSGHPDNRGKYSDREMDRWLEESSRETRLAERVKILKRVQEKAAADLPFLPLWFWTPGVLIRNDLTGLEGKDLSVSGSLEPLTHLRYR